MQRLAGDGEPGERPGAGSTDGLGLGAGPAPAQAGRGSLQALEAQRKVRTSGWVDSQMQPHGRAGAVQGVSRSDARSPSPPLGNETPKQQGQWAISGWRVDGEASLERGHA